MTDTSGFRVGQTVTVSSGAGSESAVITVVTNNVSITVASLAINHNTTTPVVTAKKWFIVHDVAATTLYLYGGTLFAIANTTISSISYSAAKVPFGFPADPSKWTTTVSNSNNLGQGTPTINVWYNPTDSGAPLKIVVPVGAWNLDWQAVIEAVYSSNTSADVVAALSTANNSSSTASLRAFLYSGGASGNIDVMSTLTASSPVLVSGSSASYFFVISTTETGQGNIQIRGDIVPTLLRAVSAYL
jgi:hypothetical protein